MTNKSDQIDSDYDVEGNNKLKRKELKNSSPLFLFVIYNVDGPSISNSYIINITPGEGQILVSFTSKSNWKITCVS